MKNILILAFIFISCLTEVVAQVSSSVREAASVPAPVEAQPKRYPQNWHMLSYSTDSVYGIEANEAYELLNGKEKKKKVVVAVIDSGCDDLHEDLKDALWVNKGEIPGNGIDDDGNGYVDDVHGWNFLANAKGVDVQKMMEAGAREFVGYKARLDELHNKKRNKKEEIEYRELRGQLMLSKLGTTYSSRLFAQELMERFKNEVVPEFEKSYPEGERTVANFEKLGATKPKTDEVLNYTYVIYSMRWNAMARNGADWKEIVATCSFPFDASAKNFKTESDNQVDERKLIGDNPEDIKDNRYGTPVLSTASAEHGTHVGSVIGAVRGNGLGLDGIADVSLMFIRAIPEIGDEYDKDAALAIRYAVDNGADIINMSFGKKVTTHKKWLDEALEYAEKKGVLIVHAAGNNFSDTDVKPFYPVKFITPRKAISSFITVGASDPQGNLVITSNYGKNSVDVFAPGIDIFGAIPGDNYKKNGGTSLATPMVSGLAALIMTYYPELSANQVKEVILKSAVQHKNAMVLKSGDPRGGARRIEVSLGELCGTGGIVSALAAVELAEEMTRE